MTYAQLLAHLLTLSRDALDKPVRTLVTGQALAITRIDEGDGNDPPMLDTGVSSWV